MRIEEQTAKLVKWIESHNKNKDGAYYSNANHPIWGVIKKINWLLHFNTMASF